MALKRRDAQFFPFEISIFFGGRWLPDLRGPSVVVTGISY